MYRPVAVLAMLLIGSFYDVCQAQPCYADLNQEVVSTYPQQCANKPGSADTAPFEEVLRDLVCDSTCGPLYNATFYQLCPSPTASGLELVNYYLAQCRVNANERACYSFYNDSDADLSVANSQAAQLCSTSVQQNTCSDQCKAQIMAINNYYGICINSVFNFSSSFVISNELLPLFTYQLWSNCGVPVPVTGSGGGDNIMPTSGDSSVVASMKVAAMLAMLFAVWIMRLD